MKNILFLLIDCLRADRCFGEGRTAKTPTIDWLRLNGLAFTQAISCSSCTTPNVASILTGLYPFQHGITSLYGFKLNPEVTTLPQILKLAGYHTYAAVTGPLIPETGLDKGFDEYRYRENLNDIGTIWEQKFMEHLKHLREPWFLFAHFFTLHEERTILPQFNFVKYGKTRYDRALSGLDVYLGRLLGNLDLQDMIIVLHGDHGENIFQSPLQKLVKSAVGRVYSSGFFMALRVRIAWLIRELIAEHNLSKDGYWAIIEHAEYLYDYLIRVPLIFFGKPFPSNKVIINQVRQIDILPTIIKVLGLTNPDRGISGKALIPFTQYRACEVYIQNCSNLGESFSLQGIRTSSWKYIYSSNHGCEELYDLRRDPKEVNNLTPQYRDLIQNLKDRIAKIISDEGVTKKMTPQERDKMEKTLKALGYL